MNNNNENSWINWLFVLAIAVWGGLIGFVGKMRSEGVLFLWKDFFLDLAIAMFAGFIVGLLARATGVGWELTLAISGVGGHTGILTLHLLTRIYQKRLESWADKG